MKYTASSATPLSLISTAIPYVNAAPHLGYVLEAVVTDAIARTQRAKGAIVHQQAGTDDNSLKNARAAAAQGVPTQTLVDHNAARFLALRELLELDWNAFVRTSNSPIHRATVERIWQACRARGDIYLHRYAGLYCVGCEQFYSEGELDAGRCLEHGTPCEPVEEQNYFFRLSRYQEPIHRLLSERRLRVVPESSHREALSFVAAGLRDFSISRSRTRSLGWGLKVPDDPSQVIYVWFDALINYLSGLGPEGIETSWARAGRIQHVIGKGILRFHAIYWPAILLSAGLRLPTDILVHGYLTVEGCKIGKSLGNAIDPASVVGEFGVDAVRYYLLRHVATTRDGDFSRERLIQAHDSELADQLGNLVQRTVALVQRFRQGAVPQQREPGPKERHLALTIRATRAEVEQAVDCFALHEALAAVFRLVAAANSYVDQTEPWALGKAEFDGASRAPLDRVLYTLADVVRCLGLLLAPFLPGTAREIAWRIPGGSLGPGEPELGTLAPGTLLRAGPPLFPKLVKRSASPLLNSAAAAGIDHR